MKGWRYYYKRLGHPIENSFRKYRAYLKPNCYSLFRSVPIAKDFAPPLVSVIDLGKTEMLTDSGRYFQALVRGLLDSSHSVYVVRKLWLVTELHKKKYSKKLIDSGKIQFIDEKQMIENSEQIDYLWFDGGSSAGDCGTDRIKIKKQIHLSLSSRSIGGDLWLPYQVHPEMECVPILNESSLERERPFGIFFIGNVGPAYESDFVKSHHVMSRIQVLETLIQNVPNTIRYENFDGNEEVDDFAKKCVFLPCYNQTTKRSNGLIPSDKYMHLLGKIDFVICTPGTYMPFAHNVIESMSQGCIPILEYGHYFSPKLVDGLNCLVYQDAESLNSAVNRAVDMSVKERIRMRKEVCRYYRDHIKFSSFLSKVDAAKSYLRGFYYG